jgi:hypothetical protein
VSGLPCLSLFYVSQLENIMKLQKHAATPKFMKTDSSPCQNMEGKIVLGELV